VAAPIPRLAPVIIATLSASRPVILCLVPAQAPP
jgi:hypothetical protein